MKKDKFTNEYERSKKIMEKFFKEHPEHDHTYDYPDDYWDEIFEHLKERDEKYKLINYGWLF